ncbi:MAG: Rrf2 family transcriptional regulator [Candidatus Rokubacteria bacterium]|nr:Rrf2 family transcriptional regulator [Candidatus Rokubacteria bacterium]
MRLSRESEYGLEGLRVLASGSEGAVMLLQDIAEAGGLPERFLAKIFQKLARQHVVRSHRGAVRGYSLERPGDAITMREILEAIEGPGLFERCAFWPSRCNAETPCVIHRQWGEMLRPTLREILEAITLAQVAAEPARSLGTLARRAVAGGRQQAHNRSGAQ